MRYINIFSINFLAIIIFSLLIINYFSNPTLNNIIFIVATGFFFYRSQRDKYYANISNIQTDFLLIYSKSGRIIYKNNFLFEKIFITNKKNNIFDIFVESKEKNYLRYFNKNDENNEGRFFSSKYDLFFNIYKQDQYSIINIDDYSSLNDDKKFYFAKKNEILNSDNSNQSQLTTNKNIKTCFLNNNKSFYITSKINRFNNRFCSFFIKDFLEEFHQQIWEIYFKNSEIPCFIVNKEKDITSTNLSFEKSLSTLNNYEYSLKNILTDDDQYKIEQINKFFNNEDLKTYKIKIGLNNNHKALAIINFQKIKGELILGCIIDITEQRDLELQFIHSQKMQAIGQLAGGIAHDFNNLLTAIIGFCDILLTRHFPGEESFTYVMHVKQNVNRAANLVKQLLALSRQQVLHSKVFNPFDVINELSFLIKRLIGANIELQIIGTENISNIKFDQGQLEQIIINLAINARDAMSEGGKLTIELKDEKVFSYESIKKTMFSPIYDEQIEEGNYVVISVIDSGTGIPKENLNKIFEPFFSTKENKGVGLGLSTVYGIIRQANGYIFVKTKKDEGSKFSLYLRIHEINHQNEVETSYDNVTENNLNDLTGNANILIIEDDESVRILMQNVLSNRGYQIFAVSSGTEALKFFEQNTEKIDIVISDIIMPGISGPKTIQKILLKQKHIKTIFISGYSEQHLDEYTIDNGKIFFLSKPFTMQELIRVIKKIPL